MDMEQYTVLIADSSQDFCKELKDILRWSCTVYTCCKCRRAAKLLKSLRPDVLVIDLMLPEISGDKLLEIIECLGYRPAIIATTNLINQEVLTAAQTAGVDYLMMKPCYPNAVVVRIREQLYRKVASDDQWEQLHHQISELLIMLGVSPKLYGFRYLQEALFCRMKMSDQPIIKELYIGVADIFHCTEEQVERTIRSAIRDAWKNRSSELWSIYFLPDELGQVNCPSNAVFITRIADGLRNFRMENDRQAGGSIADVQKEIPESEEPPEIF